MLPNDNTARKGIPLYTYLTQYHPNALVEVAKVAVAGNEQHNPGEPMHWAKGKSMDQLNTAMRHIFDHGMGNAYDRDDPYRCESRRPIMHLAKAAWRLLAEIELLCEARDMGLNIDELVRGTHEFRGLVEEPNALPEVNDYIAPVGTGPLEPMDIPVPVSIFKGHASSHSSEATQRGEVPQWPDNAGAGVPVSPKGRILHCGCFGNCKGHETSSRDPVPNQHNSRGPKDPAGVPYTIQGTLADPYPDIG